ncbi:DcrB-related protein [Enterobacter cloacae complex sp. P15RS]|uniref:DcrB-related protein n=1 Tax=Enterobacter cloacae complex sp. P15RS TaxID=2779578 RepID=UPI0018695E62|nr:DcrB-related protein [Enterobacter cloacae complex sp. P15RS]MBE3470279.1 DcrB-related protein [Enterobacter cloacae complex sp. P15RS]
MADYILQEATLALPDVFKDRTMNLFTLSDNGASEFTFVVSRASAKNEEKVHDAATRLVRELEITVPDFRLESSQMISVDGHAAVELFYQFKNDNSVIFQKQTVILLDDHPGGQKMVCYIGTCPGEFSDYYHNQYQEIIRSIRFHKPAQTETKVMLAADSHGPFFALDSESKVLSVFENIQELYGHLSLQRAKEGQYLLFEKQGQPLSIAPVPDSQPLRYALWKTSAEETHHLISQLSVCRQISGSGQLNTLDRIREYLMAQRAE